MIIKLCGVVTCYDFSLQKLMLRILAASAGLVVLVCTVLCWVMKLLECDYCNRGHLDKVEQSVTGK